MYRKTEKFNFSREVIYSRCSNFSVSPRFLPQLYYLLDLVVLTKLSIAIFVFIDQFIIDSKLTRCYVVFTVFSVKGFSLQHHRLTIPKILVKRNLKKKYLRDLYCSDFHKFCTKQSGKSYSFI